MNTSVDKIVDELTMDVIQVLKSINPSDRRLFLAMLIDKILMSSGLSIGDRLAILESVKMNITLACVVNELKDGMILVSKYGHQ